MLADAIDVPPMTLRDARASLERLSQQVSDLPAPEARAGVALGSAHVFHFYRDALGAIRDEGLLHFLRRIATPYLSRAGRHFDPRASTFTERYLHRARERRQARQR